MLSWLIKTDITDAFKIIPISPKLWPYHGIQCKGKYYFFNKLVFGSRSSPKFIDSLSHVICWIANNNYNIDNVLHLLDDFLGVVPEKEDAHEIMNTLLNIFKRLGFPLSAKKTEGPCHVLEYLGIYLDTVKMEARLPRDKVLRIQEIIVLYQTQIVHKTRTVKSIRPSKFCISSDITRQIFYFTPD